MKVVCPHCSVAYGIDDRRVPATGLNVRCPKCRNTFPVRKDAADEALPVPLPAPAGAPATAGSPFSAPVPLPAPASFAPPPAGDEGEAQPEPDFAPDFSPPAAAAAIPLPAPDAPSAPAGDDPFAFSPADYAAQDPLPVEPASPALDDEPPAAPRRTAVPLPDLDGPDPLPVEAAPPPAEALGFGEVDFASPAPSPDPFMARAAAPAAAAPPSSGLPPFPGLPPPGEELEMLFAEGGGGAAAKPAAGAGATGAFKVRRRSGKVFGPFEEAQVVEMLAKGELMGNEDVSADGGEPWTPIGAVPAFGEALRKVSADPALPSTASPGAPSVGVPFGDRMAGAKVVGKGAPVRDGDGPATPRWKKVVLPVAALVLVLGVGVGAGFTKQGFFFLRAFRRGDQGKVAALVTEARTALLRADHGGDRAALDAAARALAADPDSLEGAALHATAAALLELRHGAPAGALEQARRNADRLDAEEQGSLAALTARLAITLASTPGPATAAQENALELAATKAAPDADVVALLARSALARGDGPRAATLYAKLEGLNPGTARAGYGAGLALAAKRDAAGAQAAFDKVLQATPGHLPARLELAVLAEASGDLAAAEGHLAALLADGGDQKLAPSERARALATRGLLLSRIAEKAAAADQILEQAVQADPKLVDARLALARHRLRRGDAAGAVGALEPVAAQAAALPALAALRIRALAAAGRALDAASLADQALARSPGDPALLLAKAHALEASEKRAEAAAIFADAAARDPAAFEPRLALGRIALAAKDLPKARAELAAAVEKGPREPAAQAVLGDVAAAEGDLAGAEKAYAAALALDPEHANAQVGLAKLAVARGDWPAAKARLERALAVDPRSVEGWFQLGTIEWRARDLPAAEKALRAAVDLRPTHALALSRLGAVKTERGEDLDGALARLTAAVGEDPRIAEAQLWLGHALLKKGETPAAINALRKAVELDPKSAEYRIALGVALERSGALTEAVEEYRAAVAANPKQPEAHERLGTLFFANGRFDDAAAALEKAVAAAPKVSRYRLALGDARAKLGRHEDAARIFREVMRLDPAAVQAVYRLARAVHESQGAKAALTLYERAAKDEPKNAMPHYYLGYLYKERGQKARAAGEFRRFLELKPDADEKRDIESELEDLGAAR